MAVLPTPGSPIKTGLFFVFLDKILVILLTSSSRPITGSTFPSVTSFTIYIVCYIFFFIQRNNYSTKNSTRQYRVLKIIE